MVNRSLQSSKTKPLTWSRAVYHGRQCCSYRRLPHMNVVMRLQHANAYSMLQLRSTLVPIQNISAHFELGFMAMVFGGFLFRGLFDYQTMLLILHRLLWCVLIVCLGDTSGWIRCQQTSDGLGEKRNIVTTGEYDMARIRPWSTAMTYVVAAIGAITTLIYYVLSYVGMSGDELIKHLERLSFLVGLIFFEVALWRDSIFKPMTFQLTEEQLAVQQAARDFRANRIIVLVVIGTRYHPKFPVGCKKNGRTRFHGHDGGSKYNRWWHGYHLVHASHGRDFKVDASASVMMSVNNSLVCWGLKIPGTEDSNGTIKRLGQPVRSLRVCFVWTRSWSDATSQRTTAENKGDHYLLNGTKTGLPTAAAPAMYLVMCQTDAVKNTKASTVIVERDQQGL